MIPINALSTIIKLDAASINQNNISQVTTPEEVQKALKTPSDPKSQPIIIINNTTNSAESFFNISLRDNKEY